MPPEADWRSELIDEDPDDTLLAETPADVVHVLGFDPIEFEREPSERGVEPLSRHGDATAVCEADIRYSRHGDADRVWMAYSRAAAEQSPPAEPGQTPALAPGGPVSRAEVRRIAKRARRARRKGRNKLRRKRRE